MNYILKPREAWQIIDNYKPHTSTWHYHIIWWLLLETGRRVGEVVCLKLKHFKEDFSEVLIYMQKKKIPKPRWYQLSDKLAAEIKAYCDANWQTFREGYIFSPRASKGLHLTSHSAATEFCKLRQKLGMDEGVEKITKTGRRYKYHRVRTHSFRHTVTDALDEMGVKISTISWFLGHEKLSTTQVYLSELRREKEAKSAVILLQEKLGFRNPKQQSLTNFIV